MIEQGRDAPDDYHDRPEIEPHLVGLWNAFWELGTERQLGMAVGPIPGSKIREYLRDEMDLTGAEYDRAMTIIRKADDAYLGLKNSRNSDEQELDDVAKATDSKGVKRIVRGLGNRHKATNRR